MGGGDNVTPNLAGSAEECIRKIDIDVAGPKPQVAHHIVFFEMADTFTEAKARAAVDDLDSTIVLISGVTDVAFEKAFIRGIAKDMPYNYALTVKFDSRSALDGYSAHPLHKKW